MYLNVYAITRHYGGPEEGGWWYNWWDGATAIDTDNLTEEEITKLTELLKKAYPDEGNIYSVNGGVEYSVQHEEIRLEQQSRTRPHYE